MPAQYTRIRRRITPRKGVREVVAGTLWYRQNFVKPWIPHPGYNPPEKVVDLVAPWFMTEACYDSLHKGPPYKEGDAFKTLKCEWIRPLGLQGYGTYESSSGLERYIGAFYPGDPNWLGGPDISNVGNNLSSNSTLYPSLAGLGGQAWARTAPRPERANVLESVAELRDLPRMLQSTAANFRDAWEYGGGRLASPMSPRRAARDFLNYQFGWFPFMSDLNKMFNAYFNTQSYMDHMTHDNNRWIRRRAVLDTKSKVTKISYGVEPAALAPRLSSSWATYFKSCPTYEVFEEEHSITYAVGRFKFYRPEFDASLSGYNSLVANVNRHLTLYGARISPSNIYNATPWTWLIDWFANVGDHVDLITDMLQDSIVAKYLYVMKHELKVRRLTITADFHSRGPLTLTWYRTIESKQREPAGSPFGFDLTWDDLTPRQLAILYAIGMSGARRLPSGGP